MGALVAQEGLVAAHEDTVREGQGYLTTVQGTALALEGLEEDQGAEAQEVEAHEEEAHVEEALGL